MPSRFPALLDFDIDTHLNPFIPAPTVLTHLPYPLSHFLGLRHTPRSKLPSSIVYLWSFIGAFCSISLIAGVFLTSQALRAHNSPLILASFGASAILLFQTIDSPLAQPRNFVFGHALAALIGVSVTKLFEMNSDFENLRWLAGALNVAIASVAIASVAMGITKTVHPPAGATALMIATDPLLTPLGWWFIPCVLINTALMLGAALTINNLHRHYPAYWWSPAPVGRRFTTQLPDTLQKIKSRATPSRTPTRVLSPSLNRDPETRIAGLAGEANPQVLEEEARERDLKAEEKVERWEMEDAQRIVITTQGLSVPEELHLEEHEEATLRLLQHRLERLYRNQSRITAQESRAWMARVMSQ